MMKPPLAPPKGENPTHSPYLINQYYFIREFEIADAIETEL